jgi:hypothetical protein
MTTLLAQIAPQRSTQYAELARVLAPCELQLAPLELQLDENPHVELGDQGYVQFELPQAPDPEQARELGMLSTTSAFFIRHEGLGNIPGPLLQPLETGFRPALPRELMMARRYRGKTNELFTHYLCNIARYSSALAHRPWESLRVFDPLAGGGTTLFAALMLGASVAGVERNQKDVQTTTAFVRQFTREQRIPCKETKARLKGVGQRWTFTLGKERQQSCTIAQGDTADAHTLISGFRPHLIVGDLPYGIQHHGQLAALLENGLPAWEALLPTGGALVLAWESRRVPRMDMIDLIQSISHLVVLDEPPYDRMAHRVDRVIKRRDLIVARPRAGLAKES